jgi:hypothetical protein
VKKAKKSQMGGRFCAQSNPAEGTGVTRRDFLSGVGRATAVTLAGSVAAATSLVHAASAGPKPAAAPPAPFDPSGANLQQRRTAARESRLEAAQMAFTRPLPGIASNGEEQSYGGSRIGNFHKGLPHNGLGEVDPAAYHALLRACASGSDQDFEAIPLGGSRPLRNPQAGLAFDLEGPDSHHIALRPAPRIDSAEGAGEAAELYWMALARDVHFSDYGANPVTLAAAASLTALSGFRGPKQGGAVTPATLFRGNTPGDLNGPYLSQFLWLDIPYGSLTISQRQQTVLPGIEYMTAYGDWLNVQNGGPSDPDVFDPTPRYIRNGRDLGQYVHVDALYEAYLNACLILLGMAAPFDAGNPYTNTQKQDAFATFGGPHILSLVTEVATRALKAVWYQKWFVHRRLRPEAFGGLVHNRRSGAAAYPLHADILNSAALTETFNRFGSYLLPQQFPEGSPLHPSYGAGHATVAGACVTILKAWFDESFVLPNPVVASADGLSLVPYAGPPLTVGGELDKVAANIAMGRNFAGIHWRTDYSESLRLGEAVALGILEEQKHTYNEQMSFTLTTFDGATITL